jgi:hypothetical protein
VFLCKWLGHEDAYCSGTFRDGSFSDLGRFVMGCLVMGP